jgi:molecular chaperone GrpE
MVNKKHENEYEDSDIEITNESLDINEEVELEDSEERQADTIKSLRTKLKVAEEAKREALEELQRGKADFLNARKRLEEERKRDRERSIISHVEELIPLCDSFEMAMSNKEVWEKTDEIWRKGVEGIFAQLQGILNGYQVETLNPVGQFFNPHEHEALSTAPTDDESKNDTVVTVIQKGYRLKKADGSTELIRPARVVIGHFEK